jgi:hypothetical protein
MPLLADLEFTDCLLLSYKENKQLKKLEFVCEAYLPLNQNEKLRNKKPISISCLGIHKNTTSITSEAFNTDLNRALEYKSNEIISIMEGIEYPDKRHFILKTDMAEFDIICTDILMKIENN